MLKHDWFDLLVHSTEALESLLGEPLTERKEIHAWPLSVVELLTTASGFRWIYKSQHAPTYEPEFYERVRSPLLPDYRLLSRDSTYATILFSYVDAPCLRDMSLSEAELVHHGQAVVAAIGQIDEAAPVYIDISNQARWREFVDLTLGMLSELVNTEKMLLSVTEGDITDVAAWAESAAVYQLIDRTTRLTHGDLNPGNVFVTDNGYQVIDWQRPQLAPAQVDLATLLERTPALFRHVAPEAIGVFYFLRLFWAVNAKTNLLPATKHVFDQWSSEAIGYIRRAAGG